MQKLLIAASLAFPLLTSTAHSAEYNMRPGLWEITTTSDLLLLAPHIPKEQMQNVKDLAKEYGVDMPQIENGSAISKACITQEMADKRILPNFYQDRVGCASKNATRDGNNYRVDFACNSAELKGNGWAEGNLTSAESFSGQSRFTGTAQGTPVDEKADIAAKWVNAMCGTVKPL